MADGAAHLLRVRYTPGLDLDLLQDGPSPSVTHLQYWVEEGALRSEAFPHQKAMGTWARGNTGILQIFFDQIWPSKVGLRGGGGGEDISAPPGLQRWGSATGVVRAFHRALKVAGPCLGTALHLAVAPPYPSSLF